MWVQGIVSSPSFVYSSPRSTMKGLGKKTSVNTRCQGEFDLIRGPVGCGLTWCAKETTKETWLAEFMNVVSLNLWKRRKRLSLLTNADSAM
eukprot:CAMPEP_0206542678 /NCGR_PEP_ID=MMETSP0325_2-20121206/10326_1 /ASSEMBLY_ACC=CAM_ASM_000347 /TAXON_ID=2866 /ORGANISM="Crypthecodinium cohnii, Strain Seligo" /LENGTH=90 /DNA_ID=CAMNT_0054040803 /DNA_START=136 /DNA_END=408 /DNA_ORIENTATION=-